MSIGAPTSTGTAPGGPAPLLTGRFALVGGATLAYFLAIGMLLPTLPLYVLGPLGGSPAAVGLAQGVFYLSALVLRPWAGRLADRRGRRLLLVSGALCVAGSVAGHDLANSIPALIALRLLTGVGEGLFFVGAAAAVSDLTPPSRRGEGMSLFSVAIYAGVALGPALGERTLSGAGFGGVWLVAVLCCVAAAALGFSAGDTRPDVSRLTASPRLLHPAALRPGVIMAASATGLAAFNAFIALHSRDAGLSGSQLVFALFGALVISIRTAGAKIPQRYGFQRVAASALVISAAGLVIVAIPPHHAALYAGTAVFAIGQALAFPAIAALAVSAVPAAERGALLGSFTLFLDLGFGAGAALLGLVAALADLRMAFLTAAIVSGAGLLALPGLTAAATWRWGCPSWRWGCPSQDLTHAERRGLPPTGSPRASGNTRWRPARRGGGA